MKRMALRRGKQGGVRREVLLKLRGLEHRCEVLERDVCALGLQDQIRRAMLRISALEEKKPE